MVRAIASIGVVLVLLGIPACLEEAAPEQPQPAAENTRTQFKIMDGYVLRVYTRGGEAGRSAETKFPAAGPSRGFVIRYDSKDRMLAVAYADGQKRPEEWYFLNPISWSIRPE